MDWLQKMQEESKKRHGYNQHQKLENVVEVLPVVEETAITSLKMILPKKVESVRQGKKIIQLSTPEENKKITERPPAQYTNISSPYGIATDLHLKKE